MSETSDSNFDDLTNPSLKLLTDEKIVFSLIANLKLHISSNNPHFANNELLYLGDYLFEINEDTSNKDFYKFAYTDFRKIFNLLIKFLNNPQNDLKTNLVLSQELSEVLNKEPYSINQVTIITEYLKHYPNLKKVYFSLYNYLEEIRKLYQSTLWPLENNVIENDQNFIYYYTRTYQDNRYLNRYVLGNRIFRITFLQNKFSSFTYYLTERYISYINKTPEYENYMNRAIKSSEIESFDIPILFRGIHSRHAKDIMNSSPGDTLIFKGFQSQTYDYSNAYHFTYDFEKDIEKEIAKLTQQANKEIKDYKKRIEEQNKIINEYDYNNMGMLLRLKYPKKFKFLCFNQDEAEVLTYPNCRYQIEKIYFDDFIITCDLIYLEHDLENIKINLPNFDMQFITVLEYLDYYDYNIHWYDLYMYFLENNEVLEKIILEQNLKVKNIEINAKRYLEEFEDYINNFIELESAPNYAFNVFPDNYEKYQKAHPGTNVKNLGSKIINDIYNYFKTSFKNK